MKETSSKYCSICGCEMKGIGHNAKPYNDGRCCDNCNKDKVLPLRYLLLTTYGITSYNTIKPMNQKIGTCKTLRCIGKPYYL